MVGGYQRAKGRLLREAIRWHTPIGKAGRWRIDYAEARLAEGPSLERYPLLHRRQAQQLYIRFPKGLPRHAIRIRIAVHSERANRTQHFTLLASDGSREVAVWLPDWATGHALHLYYTVECANGTTWGSGYVAVKKERRRSSRSKRTRAGGQSASRTAGQRGGATSNNWGAIPPNPG
ncbi:MAG: hypothetical protein CSA97_04895 [Bacteroidetes bacterium]|nr:MAG: hypothetical protein CSA97_04895 [Bacteroidota bacterium]